MQSKAKTVKQYLAELPPDRRVAISAVRNVIVKNLPKGYEESMSWGMITYSVPLKILPETYNGQPLCYAGLASQKQHMAVYLMNVYGDPATLKWFQGEFKKAGKRLDMGKSCIRFKKLDDLPLEVIGQAVARTPLAMYVKMYEQSRQR
jgi:uncharacterized protein YdhG (YjbR/CyaY superfamily)